MLDLIKSRRSIRKFIKQDIPDELIRDIIDAGRWAPSGLNNQPWKFVIVRSQEMKAALAAQTRYGRIIRDAPLCIAVFFDAETSYDRTKDIQAIGACIQNMLLAVHALGLGGVWLGEILKNAEKVREILDAPQNVELMAVIAIGYSAEKAVNSDRKDYNEVVLAEK
jgi:nitroreductase